MLRMKSRPFWVCILLLVGIYLPTSSRGEISLGWARLELATVCLVLVALLISGRGLAKKDLVATGLLIVLLLIACTPFSLLPITAYGLLGPYAVFALILSTRLENIRGTRLLGRAFLLVSGINIFLGFAILLHFDPVQSFFVDHYSAYYPELVPVMMDAGKPVLTYATHSLAGFLHYLFFWVNLCAYRQTGKKLHLLFAICFLVFLLSLMSVSGMLFFCIAFVQLLWTLLRGKFLLATVSAGFVAIALLAAVLTLRSQGYFSEGLSSAASDIILSQENGFVGRYSSTGSLLSIYDYLTLHPYRPVGLKTDGDLFLADSGPISYYMRGTILLVILMYGGLFLFLRRNLHDRRHAYLLFAMFMCFEVGFSALTSVRALCALPLFVVYLNGIRRAEPVRSSGKQLVVAMGPRTAPQVS